MGIPSVVAEYCAMGLTTMRFGSVTLRTVNGVKIAGGAATSVAMASPDCCANQRSKAPTYAASRTRRFSCEMRCERVSSE